MATSAHKITIDAPKDEVFEAITTVDGLKGWYSPDVSGKGEKGGQVTLVHRKGRSFQVERDGCRQRFTRSLGMHPGTRQSCRNDGHLYSLRLWR